MYTLHRQQVVNRPLGDLFDFLQRPENLALITPTNLDFKLLTPSPVPMEKGSTIDYTIRFMGVKLRWRSLISDYEAPHFFVIQQVKGPCAFWHHAHRFEDLGGRTRIIDEVRYQLPVFVPFGSAINRWWVEPRLQQIFNYRAAQYSRLFGGEPAEPIT